MQKTENYNKNMEKYFSLRCFFFLFFLIKCWLLLSFAFNFHLSTPPVARSSCMFICECKCVYAVFKMISNKSVSFAITWTKFTQQINGPKMNK